jgi:hypothetical protein
VIDAAAASASATQISLVTAPAAQNVNQFLQTPILGMLDQGAPFYGTISCEIDASESGTLVAGQPVKMFNSAGGVPKVVAASAVSDNILGYITYNKKDVSFVAGDRVEISTFGNVMYLISVGAIDRGAQVEASLLYVGGVKTETGSSGARVVGWAFDKATADGTLIRVMIQTPSRDVA